MRIGVSSYSFHQLVSTGAMTQLEVIPKAREMGFDVIEFSAFTLPEGETPLSFAPKVRAECDRVGIAVANYTIYADFLNGSGGDWQAEVARLKDEVRVAAILGSPGMRHDATWGPSKDRVGAKSFDALLPILADGCRAVTDFASGFGIRTMVENHGYFAQDSERVEKLVAAVDHPNFGLLVDMGNFLCADEDPAAAVARALPYAFHVHAKDFHVKSGLEPDPGEGWFQSRAGNYLRGAIIGHGNAPIAQCVRLLKRAGYDGVLSVEFEGLEDPLKGIALGQANLRRFMDQASA